MEDESQRAMRPLEQESQQRYPSADATGPQSGGIPPTFGYGVDYPGAPSPQATYPGQAGPPPQAWSPPGYPMQPGYGWLPASSMPIGYTPGGASPTPHTARKRLPILAIIGLVMLMMVVSLGGATGLLLTLGPRLSNGGGLFAHLGHATSAVEPTPISYNYDFTDSLNGAVNVGWATNQYCVFKEGVYHVNPGPSHTGYLSQAPVPALYDLDMRVTVSEASGALNTGYGLILRYQSTSGYVFVIDSDGQAWFDTVSAGKETQRKVLWNSTTFTRGLNADNTIRVIARGSSFTFYINGEQVGQVTDSSYALGYVGLYSGANNLDAAFSNFELHGNR